MGVLYVKVIIEELKVLDTCFQDGLYLFTELYELALKYTLIWNISDIHHFFDLETSFKDKKKLTSFSATRF